jgi:hypothetical protein
MSQNQDCEKKVIEEIERELEGETPNFENVKKLKYLGTKINFLIFIKKIFFLRSLLTRNFKTSSSCTQRRETMHVR